MPWNPMWSTTTYGRKLRPTTIPGEFKLRIYTGGFAGSGTAGEHAANLLDAHKSAHGFSSYEITAQESHWFPSCVDYTVRFRK